MCVCVCGGGGLKLLHVTHSEEKKKKRRVVGRIALLYKAEGHWSWMRCVSCCLITLELFKIEVAAAEEYF